MSVERFEVLERKAYAEGRSFGETGAYELVRGRLHYAVDPAAPDAALITDLSRAPRGADGCVRFSGDLVLVQPVDAAKGNGALLIDVPNRGRPLAPGFFNRAPRAESLADPLHPGDGFLFRRGFAVASVAWQWNTPRLEGILRFDAPDAAAGGSPLPGQAYADLRPNRDAASWPISHLGQPGYPSADGGDPTARLFARDYEDAEPTEIPRERWRFAAVDQDGVERPSAHDVLLEGGFRAGKIYELVYAAANAPVVGAGLLAFRDAARFLRGWEQPRERLIAYGASQSGRFLRHLLYLGLNQNPEGGGRVFDGMHIHIAGGIRGEFNHRYAQPSQLFSASFAPPLPVRRHDHQRSADGAARRSAEAQRRAGSDAAHRGDQHLLGVLARRRLAAAHRPQRGGRRTRPAAASAGAPLPPGRHAARLRRAAADGHVRAQRRSRPRWASTWSTTHR